MKNLIVKDYILIAKEESENFKKIKRRLNKQKILQFCKQYFIKEFNDKYPKEIKEIKPFTPYEKLLHRYEKRLEERNKKNIGCLELLKKHLIDVKKNKITTHIGFLTDDNVINHNIMELPDAPNEWDILFLQYDVNEYDFEKNDNVHWCKVNISDSKHFIINNNSIDLILDILKQYHHWNGFINKINDLRVYGITQSFFSEKIDNYIHFPYDKWNAKNTTQEEKDKILIEYSKSGYNKLKSLHITPLDWNDTIRFYDNKISNMDPKDKYVLLPSISLICLANDVKRFIHLLHTFLKIDYPMDKLELIVVDDMDIDKRLKGMIPNDSRIKFINLKTKKKEKESEHIPLGYKLNIGAKYANNNLIFHFFDNDIYFPDNFRNIVKCYLLSKKEMIIGNQILEHDKQKNISNKINIYNINNMLYSKRYWLLNMFQEIDDPNVILYKFISFRKNTIVKIPSIFWSFSLNEQTKTIWREKQEIDINLETLISNNIKESYDLLFDN